MQGRKDANAEQKIDPFHGSRLKFKIRRGQPADLMPYLQACQLSAEKAYAHFSPAAANLFSRHHYFHPDAMSFWEEMAINDGRTNWWVAEVQSPQKEIAGGICLRNFEKRSERMGFYISPRWQGIGLGRELLKACRPFEKRPLFLEVYEYAQKNLDHQLSRGAQLTGRRRVIHWASWPEGVNLVALEMVFR